MGRQIDLVICDFDNTLVDSETMNTEMFVRFFAETAGVTSTEEDRAYIDSAAFADVIHRYVSMYHTQIENRIGTLSEEQIAETFLDYKTRTIDTYTLRRPSGLTKLLESDIPLAIVSGSYQQEITTVADAIGLPLSRFSPVLGSDLYRPWKPDPAGLLIAAEHNGSSPPRVAVIEDSIVGLTAAKRAGMIPIHIQEFSIVPATDITKLAAYSYADIDTFCNAWLT